MTQPERTWPTLVDMCRDRATENPDRRTFVHLGDGEAETAVLTLGLVDYLARAIAVRLRDIAPLGARALLCYPSGLEFVAAFFCCLYAGVVAVPVTPLTADRKDAKRAPPDSVAPHPEPERFPPTAATSP